MYGKERAGLNRTVFTSRGCNSRRADRRPEERDSSVLVWGPLDKISNIFSRGPAVRRTRFTAWPGGMKKAPVSFS